MTPGRRLTAVTEARVCWASVAAWDQAIDERLADNMEVIAERETSLLREWQRMWLDEDLLGMPRDTVIVAARRAWQAYQDLHASMCQPDRALQPVRHLGFSADGRILPLDPRILERHPHVVVQAGRYPGPLGVVVDALRARGPCGRGTTPVRLVGPDPPGDPHVAGADPE